MAFLTMYCFSPVSKTSEKVKFTVSGSTNKVINDLVDFMKKVSNQFDNKNVFELDKIERMVKIGNY